MDMRGSPFSARVCLERTLVYVWSWSVLQQNDFSVGGMLVQLLAHYVL